MTKLNREGIKATIYNCHGAGNGLGGVRGEPLQGAHQLLGLQEATKGGVAQNGVGAGCEAAIGVGQQCAVLVGQQEAGGNSINPQAATKLGGQLSAQILGPVHNSCLGNTMSWEIKASEADYDAISPLSEEYAKNKCGAPHSWHAAEMFCYLIEMK